MKMTKFLWHKILLSFFPVLLITQNVAWITINKNLGITFLIALLVVVGLVWSKNSKAEVSIASHSISKWFSLLLPISVLIMTVVASSKITEEIWDSTAGQAWAIIWTGFAALIGTFIAIIVGVVLLIIFHA